MNQQRREFLKQTAAAAAVVTLGGVTMSAEKKEDAISIVDTHHHLWDLKKFRLPWTSGVPKLNRSFVMKDYDEATKGLNVVKSVYMEVDVTPEQRVEEAEYVIEICKSKKTPMRAAVISGEPSAPDLKDYMKQFKDSPTIKGVRRVLHPDSLPPGHCLKPEFIKGVRLLGEMGKTYDIVIRHAELGDAAKLVDACPDTRFILDHCGNANVQMPDMTQWKKDIHALAQRKNLICKVSGIIASAKPNWKPADLAPFIQHVIAEFGWNRVVFGGDWPVCTLTASYKQWVDALKEIVSDATPEQKRKLFHDNAVRFYGLK
jgi:predicted TIM-barrel fold metal-dependent hydrolase